MTAQIGVINKKAAVLASDTATTVRSGERPKIFLKPTKIFPVRPDLPVAIMMNDSTHFLDVPWDRIVDLYGSTVKEEKNTLNDYLDGFIAFIESNQYLTSYNQNIYSIKGTVHYELKQLYDRYQSYSEDNNKISELMDNDIKSLQDRKRYLVDPDMIDIVRISIADCLEEINSHAINDYKKLLLLHKEKIKDFITLSFMKSFTNNSITQIIFAGFGRNDFYPSIMSLKVQGLFENSLRCSEVEKVNILHYEEDPTSSAHIKLFAQSEVSHIFLSGIDEDVEANIKQIIKGNHRVMLDYLNDHPLLVTLSEKDKDRLIKDLEFEIKLKELNLGNEIKTVKEKNYFDPIVDSINFMNIDDLTVLAKSLIDFTSIRRRYSINQIESVGGQTQVVVLEKHKGFRRIENNENI